MSKTEIKKTNPILKAYLISTAAFFVPCWIASALLNENIGPENPTPQFYLVLILFGLSLWSPSVGLFMFKWRLYAILSGFGRLVIVAGCIYLDQLMLADLPDGQGHAYLSFLGIKAAFVWGTVDFVLIYISGQKYLNKL